MNKFLSFLFLLFSTQLFAADNPVGCSGANCKVKLETRDGSNAKVAAGQVDGTGLWTFGPAAGAVTHNMLGSLSFGVGSNTGTPTYGMRRNGSNALEFFTNSVSVGNSDSSGSWTLGVGGSSLQTINGSFKVTTTQTNGTSVFQYTLSSGTVETCTSKCGAEPTGANANSGNCVSAWTSGGVPSTCATSAASQICFCTAVQ